MKKILIYLSIFLIAFILGVRMTVLYGQIDIVSNNTATFTAWGITDTFHCGD